jgi:hypothetical protein
MMGGESKPPGREWEILPPALMGKEDFSLDRFLDAQAKHFDSLFDPGRGIMASAADQKMISAQDWMGVVSQPFREGTGQSCD